MLCGWCVQTPCGRCVLRHSKPAIRVTYRDTHRLLTNKIGDRMKTTKVATADPRTFRIGDTVALRGDVQWTGTVTGVGPGEVAVRWNHQADLAPWLSTQALELVTGVCPHCGIKQFHNENADPALDAMKDLCWKCVKPLHN